MNNTVDQKIESIINNIHRLDDKLGMACEILLRQLLSHHHNNEPAQKISNTILTISIKLKAETSVANHKTILKDLNKIEALMIQEQYHKPGTSIFDKHYPLDTQPSPNTHPNRQPK